MRASPDRTRRRILAAALRQFARRGYAGASVQAIATSARVTKPALYYHFGSKTGLFRALVDSAHDERYRLMEAAASGNDCIARRLEDLVAAVFDFSRRNVDLMRLTIATAFAAKGELPPEARGISHGRRTLDLFQRLMADAQRGGELDPRADSEGLAFGLYGQINIYVMAHMLLPNCPLDRCTARRIVRLFLEGAARH